MRRPRGRAAGRAAGRADESGSAVVEFIWLGLLLLVPLLWIVISVFEVQRGAFAVSGAARAAGRAYVLAADDGQGEQRARAAARLALADQGLAEDFDLRVSCTPYPQDCHAGTSVVTVVVASRVNLPLLPSALGGSSPSFALDATHTLPVGRFQERHEQR
ncbi:hypothetical protein [Nocardioides sp.]|uniref:hypothetical protein n=1 Tax=Nocardioides sp. TaxID=35761 RepID=UPI00356391C9